MKPSQQIIVIFVVVARLSIPTRAVSCSQIVECHQQHNVSQLSEDDPQESCRILLDSASCIDEALADCRTRPETKVKADELEARMKTIKDALSEKCVTSVAVPLSATTIVVLLHCSVILLASP
ncbi:uncharacterized protein LOC112560275 [Pomacea canaliculata]|uniref:uncharacterized protein LOC112560275 n=1 Tax=Pomacea canaliculata TaxID=400727 RepID=UPI000D72F68F|nr:uncharacterized protein LOC112560275 [Pomacea canaliculata]XP_025087796.1 uncharacterized protein LOC112560275 [Pomacea canaliculata]